MSDFDAYWIDPHGRTSGIPYRHINDIIAHPTKYGLTDKYVKGLYKKHKERLGQEGNAREEIMLDLMKKGWIRVRKVVSGSMTWTVQCWGMNSTAIKHILGWVLDMAKSDDISKNTELNIMDTKNGRTETTTVGKAVKSLGESVKKKKSLLERKKIKPI